MHKLKNSYKRGFTIVELLIVIVVIGILATISVVAYSNISQRAYNATVISSANNSMKMIQAYVAEYGKYPLVSSTSTTACVTTESGCTSTASVASFNTEMAKIGTLPKNIQNRGSSGHGIRYQYTSSWTVDGVSHPAGIVYWLDGTNQNCGVDGILASTSATTTWSTTGYTTGNSGGKTRCDISIPGPAHL